MIPHEQVNTLHDYTADYHIFSSYGLFRRMTGVNGRPELIFEGSADGKNWLEFEFYYKPGKTDKLSLPVIPHQPRLEWQLWFAAFAKGPQDLYLVSGALILDKPDVQATNRKRDGEFLEEFSIPREAP